MIQIRRATYNDLASLAEIQISSWKNAFKDILSESELNKYTDSDKCVQILKNVYNSNIGYLYIADISGKPCAELFWRKGTEIEQSAEIVALHSVPESWGHGVGRAIMDKAINDVYNDGFKIVYLWVFEENKRARRFYEKYGFVADGKSHISIYENAIEVRYVLKS